MKRVNRKKAEIAALTLQKADVLRQKEIIRKMWPFVAEGLTIYDAETVANAVAGFIKYEIERKVSEIKVADLAIDVTNEKDTAIKLAMMQVLELFKDEKASDSAQLLERFGKTLGLYSAHTYMKQNMSVLKVEDIVS